MNRIILHKSKLLNTGYNYIYKFLLAIIVGLLVTEFERITLINLSLLRYLIYSLALYYFFKGIIWTYSTVNYRGFFIKSLITILFLSIIYSIIIAIPSIFSSADNYVNFKKLLSGNFLLFLFPFILLIKTDLFVWKRIFVLSYKLSVLYLLFTIPFIVYFATDINLGAEDFVRNFASSATIILLTIVYHSKRVKIVTVLTFIISFLLMVLLARRNQILYLSSIFIFLLFIMFFSSSKQIKRSKANFIVGLLFIISLSFLVIYFLNLDFSLVSERLSISAREGINYSRETVLKDFENDFNKNPADWFFGRGFNGTFFSTHCTDNFGGYVSGQRDTIENGYYYLILKGGLLYLIPFVLLSLIGLIKGFFYSSNSLSKAAAAIVLINLIDLVGFGLPGLNLKYLTLWFSLTLCYSSQIRNCSDDLVKQIVGLK